MRRRNFGPQPRGLWSGTNTVPTYIIHTIRKAKSHPRKLPNAEIQSTGSVRDLGFFVFFFFFPEHTYLFT